MQFNINFCYSVVVFIFLFSLLTACQISEDREGAKVHGEPVSKKRFYGKSNKIRAYLNLKIQSSPSENPSHLVLTGKIDSSTDFGLSKIEWKFPDHIRVENGLIEQEKEIKLGSYEVKLTLDSSDLKTGDRIFLIVYKIIGGKKHGATTSYYHP